MNIKRIFLMELGMAVIGLAGILAYKRSVKRYGRIVETPAVIDKVGNDAEELVPSQVPLYQTYQEQNKSHPWHGERMVSGVEERDDP